MTYSIPDLMALARTIEKQWDDTLRTLAVDLERIEDDAYSSLKAACYEPQEADGLRAWCITHDQSLVRCENQENVGCEVGQRADEGNDRGDPTGAAAIAGNPNRGKLRQIRRELENLVAATGRLSLLTASGARSDSAEDRKAAAKANERPDEGCDPCARAGAWTPPLTKGPTDVNGRLDKKVALCRWHFDFVVTYGELPTEEEEERHKNGRKVTRLIRQTDRLRRGMEKGRL